MERTVTVAIREGLHARPAVMFVREAAQQRVPVTISLGSVAPVDASSILGVMTLGASAGQAVTLRTEGDGPDDIAALCALEAFPPPRGHLTRSRTALSTVCPVIALEAPVDSLTASARDGSDITVSDSLFVWV